MTKKNHHSNILHAEHGHAHPYSPEEHERDAHSTGLWGAIAGTLHLPGHGHAHAVASNRDAMFTNRLGVRTLFLSLSLLLATTLIQFVIYFASSSVALLADTIHNLGDALNSIPLLIAFWLARRPVTKRYTYGYARAEDLGGLLVVASIIFSAIYIIWEVGQKFINPAPLQNAGWVVLAAIIGFIGNEAVAWLEIRTGTQIGSEAMVVDGRHARIDGLTSLAVLPAVLGSVIGLPILDPIFGILIGIAILFITWSATKSIWYRMMDAVDPATTEDVHRIINATQGVQGIRTLRLRWVGHSLWVEGSLKINEELNLKQALSLTDQIKSQLEEQTPNLGEVTLSVS
jgi:cation diffusion facilitator family transporter